MSNSSLNHSDVIVGTHDDDSSSLDDSTASVHFVQDPAARAPSEVAVVHSRVAGFRGRWLDEVNEKTARARNAQATDLGLPCCAPRTAVAEELQPYINATRWPHNYSAIPPHLQQLLRPPGTPYLLILDSRMYRTLRHFLYVFLLLIYVAFGVFFVIYWLSVWIDAPSKVKTFFGTAYMLLGVCWGFGALVALYLHCCMPFRQQFDIFAPAPQELRVHILALHMLYAADRIAGRRGQVGEMEEVPQGQQPSSIAEMDIPVRLQDNRGYLLHKHTVYSNGSVMYEYAVVQENHWLNR